MNENPGLPRFRSAKPGAVPGISLSRPVVALLVISALVIGACATDMESARFLRVEVASGGVGPSLSDFDVPIDVRLLKGEYTSGRWGVGLTGLDVWGGGFIDDNPWEMVFLLPVHCRYSLGEVPRAARALTFFAPSYHIDAVAECFPVFWQHPVSLQLGGRLTACCDVDYYGLGIGAEAGAACGHGRRGFLYLQLRLRLLTGSFRLDRVYRADDDTP
jgi:hypothetical protein